MISRNVEKTNISGRFLRHLLNEYIGRAYEYDRWAKEIPPLKFEPYMLVTVIPPWGGAVIRFIVSHKDYPHAKVSVYLDCYDMLGAVGEPYWEAYPYLGGDAERITLTESWKLVGVIARLLEDQVERIKKGWM